MLMPGPGSEPGTDGLPAQLFPHRDDQCRWLLVHRLEVVLVSPMGDMLSDVRLSRRQTLELAPSARHDGSVIPTSLDRRRDHTMQSVPLILLLFALLGGAVAAIFAPLYLDLFRRELSRADEMEETARTLGLRFSRGDPAYPGSTAFRYPFELFSRGIEQTCENFVTGSMKGFDLVAFDFLYRQRVDSDGEPNHDARSEPIRYSCALATVEGNRPHVVVEPASAPLTARADGEPVHLEWGDFNARY